MKTVNYFTRKSDLSEAFNVYHKSNAVLHSAKTIKQLQVAGRYNALAREKILSLNISRELANDLCNSLIEIELKLDILRGQ